MKRAENLQRGRGGVAKERGGKPEEGGIRRAKTAESIQREVVQWRLAAGHVPNAAERPRRTRPERAPQVWPHRDHP